MQNDVDKLLETFSEIMKTIHQRSYQKLVSRNLYPGQPKLLALIKENEGIPQKELAEKNCVKPSTITEMLNKLEANKYVTRVPDDTDKRIMRIYLTEEGRITADQSIQFMKALTNKLFDGFTDEELKIYSKLTDKIKYNLFKNNPDNSVTFDK